MVLPKKKKSYFKNLSCHIKEALSSFRSCDFLLFWWWRDNVTVSGISEDREIISSHGVGITTQGFTDFTVSQFFLERCPCTSYTSKANVGKGKKYSNMASQSDRCQCHGARSKGVTPKDK